MNLNEQIANRLESLASERRLRSIPGPGRNAAQDFTSNDYLGLAAHAFGTAGISETLDDLPAFINGSPEFEDFRRLQSILSSAWGIPPEWRTSSASRLLAGFQEPYACLEGLLGRLYGRQALLFNSGYHANTGVIGSLGALPDTVVLADKLIHASVIDGLAASHVKFDRFRHNDPDHLERLVRKHRNGAARIVAVTEGIFSMDGDLSPLEDLAALKSIYPELMLYVDEAHSFGTRGPLGLGVAEEKGLLAEIDILIGTFGKAAASAGAFAAVSAEMKEWLVNTARSFIFSTAIPPVNVFWTMEHVLQLLCCGERRRMLFAVAKSLRCESERFTGQPSTSMSHIVPIVTGSPESAVELAAILEKAGIHAMAIRRPTVPPGQDRVRLSASAFSEVPDLKSILHAFNLSSSL